MTHWGRPFGAFRWRIASDEFLYQRQKSLQTRDGGKDSSKISSSEIINYIGYESLRF